MTMDFLQEYERWLNAPQLTEAEKDELRALRGDEKAIRSRFNGLLSFGTAGLRGTMAMGTSQMNRFVIRHATQAFAEVVLAEAPADAVIAVCHDCRNHSREFAVDAACVAAANGIRVRLFEAMRPTPELSFAVRRYGCAAGINVTASHNPKEYNGYKVYWADGAQLPPRHADAVAARMAALDIFDAPKYMPYDEAVSRGLITLMGRETDEEFLACAMAEVPEPEVFRKAADSFKMVFTPFHGAGRELIPEALRRMGLKHVFCEERQMVPDGDFPTVKSPNPENPEGFYLCEALADKVGADFILGSDPDADRVGVMVRGRDGRFRPLSGNQAGVLLTDYLIGARRRTGSLPPRPMVLKSLVSTEMARRVAELNGVGCADTFTGFKFIAEKKDRLEQAGEGKVIFSFEESYGYMAGDFVRDKDAVTASLLLVGMAAWYALQGLSLLDALELLYDKYGCYNEKTLNLVMPGLDGAEKMKALMASLRETPPAAVAGIPVALARDYLPGTETTADGVVRDMELKDSNVLSYCLADGTVVIIRPSGTEPKIKVYVMAKAATREACDETVEKCSAWALALGQ